MRKVIIMLLVVLLFPMSVYAMGPLMIANHVAAWDRSADQPGASVTGYYIYWRAAGSGTWLNTQRSSPILQPAVGVTPTFDLQNFNLPNGQYEICATAYNSIGESGPSNIVPFQVSIPASPSNLKTQ